MVLTLVACNSENFVTDKPNMTGLKVRIETTFIAESVKFYSEYLGMAVLESWDENGDRGVILGLDSRSDGQAFLEFGYEATPQNYDGISVQIRVSNLLVIMEKLRGKIEFSGPDERPWGSKYLYLKDPSGIQVILYEGKL